MRRFGLIASSAVVVCLAGLWLERERIATDLVDGRLAAAGVRGSYRVSALGPARQVIEDVRLGDPARPDLVASRVELRWRYRLGLPELASVRATGVRLSARWRDGRVSLGALDRLMPRAGAAAPALPDLALDLSDATLALVTPAGLVQVRLDGRGNPTRDFAGTVRTLAPALAIGGCAIDGAAGALRVRAGPTGIRLIGTLRTGQAACPAVLLRPGRAEVNALVAPALDHAHGVVSPVGFGGNVGRGRLGPVRGIIRFDATPTEVGGRAALRSAGPVLPQMRADAAQIVGSYRIRRGDSRFDGDLSLIGARATPAAVSAVSSASQAATATPLGPIAAQVGDRLTELLSRSDLQATLAFGMGAQTTLRVTRARLAARGGAEAVLAGALDLAASGDWALHGRVSGRDLPTAIVQASGIRKTGVIEAVVTPSPYRAGTAALTLDPVRLRAQGGTIRIVTRATLSGPLGSGAIEGLVLPIALTVGADGGAEIDGGCVEVGVRQARLASFTLDPARVRLCGKPAVAVSRDGTVKVDAHLAALAITGRSGAAPLRIDSGPVALTRRGFAAERVSVSLGAGPDPTQLAIGTLAGRFDGPGQNGRFDDAAGSIANVPLALSGAAGTWAVDGGTLRLEGALAISDRATSARFARLASRDVTLSLTAGRIVASGTLMPESRSERVAIVTLHHDLAQGRGGADIAVPALTFARRGLQPEMLTPLTLGVIANVAGTVHGAGRIDWSPAGTTSNGTFRTDRLDLAAAFGPVTGLSGSIRFTDLLGLVTAPHQEARVAAINPGVAVTDGLVRYRLLGADRVAVEEARWPFAGGTLTLEPALLDFSASAERRLTFRVDGLDAAAFVQQLDFPNIAATGTFDGRLPMVFGQEGGRIEGGGLRSRGGGTLAYVGPLSNAQLGTMGKIAFDALKAIGYSRLDLALDGKLDGEIVTRVGFDGVRQGPGTRGLVARAIRDLPFRFNIAIRAPFRALVGTAASYANPTLLLQQAQTTVQPPDSAGVR